MLTPKPTGATRKITVTVPVALLERLAAYVPARRRSDFIVEAIDEYLMIVEQAEALEDASGAWAADRHPDMQTPADIDGWLDTLRSSWQEDAPNESAVA
jgi:hypothetical protein